MIKSLTFLFIFAFLIGCSSYNKVLKEDNYQSKFELANNLYDKKKYDQAIALYEQVYQHSPRSGEGELAYYRIGKSFYAVEDFYMAGYYLGTFFDKFPLSPKVEEAFFLKTLCSVNNSPQASLDQQETEIALSEIQKFIYLYPNSSKIDTCNQIMDKLRYKLELKDVQNVRLYSKTLNYKSAVVTAKTFVTEHPASTFIEEVYSLLIKNQYLLAKNSIEDKKIERIEETSETYRNFVALYPSSKYVNELKSDVTSLEEELIKLNSK